MLISILFSSLLGLDSPAHNQDLRAVLDQLPRGSELIVGTASGEESFNFEFELDVPVEPEPKVYPAVGYISWSDSFRLKPGSSMQVGKKKIEFGCAIVLGTAYETDEQKRDYRIQVVLYPTHERCGTAKPQQANPNWLSFVYNSKQADRVLGAEFSHLYNKFNAVYPQP